jgi:hypothetical protein
MVCVSDGNQTLKLTRTHIEKGSVFDTMTQCADHYSIKSIVSDSQNYGDCINEFIY